MHVYKEYFLKNIQGPMEDPFLMHFYKMLYKKVISLQEVQGCKLI